MGRASAVLGRGHAAAFVALLAALVVYYGVDSHLPNVSLWWDVAFFGVVLIPAVFALVWLALPLHSLRPALLGAGGVLFGGLAVLLHLVDLETASNLTKLAAVTLLAWWFLGFFETASWVLLVACIIPWVDAYSVWRGPTGQIVEKRPGLYEKLSFAFPPLGGDGAARLGVPDLLFFALFLAAAVRFRLRPGWTWVGMTASFGVTIALAVAFDVDGLPALPGLSLGFLLPNADLLWRAVRPRREQAS